MNEPRVSDDVLARSIIEQGSYFASFRAGINCIGGAQAKAGWDALLDLRDARAALRLALPVLERLTAMELRDGRLLYGTNASRARDAVRAALEAKP